MKGITFQFVRGDALISHLIEWKGDSEISHVNVVTPDGQLLGALMQDGVKIRPADYAKFALQIRVTIPVTNEQYEKFWASVNAKVGCAYDKAGILGIALGDNIAGPGTVFCSELQAKAIQDAQIIWIAKDASKIDPETLRLLVTAIPGAKEERITG
jgi:hypothetical protein